MAFEEDLTAFLSDAEFAVRCELRRGGALVRSFLGIFDEMGLDADLGEYRLETSQPRLNARAVDLSGAARGDMLLIEPGTPRARECDVMATPMADGTGWAVLRLAPRNGQGRP